MAAGGKASMKIINIRRSGKLMAHRRGHERKAKSSASDIKRSGVMAPQTKYQAAESVGAHR